MAKLFTPVHKEQANALHHLCGERVQASLDQLNLSAMPSHGKRLMAWGAKCQREWAIATQGQWQLVGTEDSTGDLGHCMLLPHDWSVWCKEHCASTVRVCDHECRIKWHHQSIQKRWMGTESVHFSDLCRIRSVPTIGVVVGRGICGV